jgi:hypothetical protein
LYFGVGFLASPPFLSSTDSLVELSVLLGGALVVIGSPGLFRLASLGLSLG